MRASLAALPLLAAASASSHSLEAASLIKDVPSLPLGLYRHLQAAEVAQRAHEDTSYLIAHSDQVPFLSPSSSSFPPHFFDQLVSHDPDVPAPQVDTSGARSGSSSASTFKQRFWYDASFYKKGGPVFLLDAGETNAEGRIPFLETGILKILSEATGGIGIVFEHRYCQLSLVANTSCRSHEPDALLVLLS